MENGSYVRFRLYVPACPRYTRCELIRISINESTFVGTASAKKGKKFNYVVYGKRAAEW